MNEIELSMGQEIDLNPPSDPYDFKGWTQYFSKIGSLNIASMAGSTFENCISNFKKFLHTFPWLYAYWDKLANFTWSSRCELSLSQNIFSSALSKTALYYSIDMWLCCIKFFKANLPQTEQDKMRQIYTAALDAVGGHYCSGDLWHLALNYEDENRRSTFPLLAKALTYATSDLKQFWAELQLILPKTPLSHFKLFLENKEKTATELLPLFDEIALQPSQISELEQQQQQLIEDTEERSICINMISEIYNSSLDKVSNRCKFEENINRQFFHFNAPDEAQISNWECYASFLEEELKKTPSIENFNDTVLIYERALIPCAFIDTLWIQYANFLEDCLAHDFTSIEDVRKVYQRIPFHVLPGTKIIYAEFEEIFSPTENAPTIYAEMAESNNAEQIIASASYQIRSNSVLNRNSDQNSDEASSEIAVQILRNGRNRLYEKGDIDGASAVAAFLLDAFGEISEGVSGAIYVSKWSQIYSNSDPDAVSNYLYDAIYNSPSLFEDKLELLKIYLEYMRRHGSKASFQLQLECEYFRMKNKFIWNKDYFNQKFILSKQGPEQKAKDWTYYSKEIK